MSDREERLRSLLDKVKAKRPGERSTRAAEAIDRIRAESGTTSAATTAGSSRPVPPAAQPTPVPSAFPTSAPSSPVSEPPTSPKLESPTRYSSQPPHVERPLSVEPRARSVRPSSGAPAAMQSPSRRPESIRPHSVSPTGQPVIYSTDQPEFPRPKTFGDLLDLTLSLRPR
ncbi:MAG: hypothetical protein AMJ62_11750 [Myxococcales bacterium SG8_38]|nr:MAG: hypothetical protein AMJ62_11750 [Myxococcales bacterium SG8_38]